MIFFLIVAGLLEAFTSVLQIHNGLVLLDVLTESFGGILKNTYVFKNWLLQNSVSFVILLMRETLFLVLFCLY